MLEYKDINSFGTNEQKQYYLFICNEQDYSNSFNYNEIRYLRE